MSAIDKLRKLFGGPGPRPPLKILAASGQLGYGIPEPALQAGFARQPHAIAADMGSVDPGPSYLGSGRMATTSAMTKRDITLVLEGARRLDVPLLIGSAGTAGTTAQLREVAWPQEVGNIPHRLLRDQSERLGGDLQNPPSVELCRRYVVRRQAAVGRLVGPQGQDIGVVVQS